MWGKGGFYVFVFFKNGEIKSEFYKILVFV